MVWLDLWGIERQGSWRGSLGLARLTEEFGFLPKDLRKRWRTPTAETDGAGAGPGQPSIKEVGRVVGRRREQTSLRNGEEVAQNAVGVITGWLDTLAC